MTSFIDVDYKEGIATVGTSIDLDPDLSIIAGGVLDEESEMLYHFRGPASMYVLDWEEEHDIVEEFELKTTAGRSGNHSLRECVGDR